MFVFTDSQKDHGPFGSVVFSEKFPLWFWKKINLVTARSL